MTTSTENMLHKFYVSYAAWLDGGAIGGDFVRNSGLCGNLFDYCEGHLRISPSNYLFEIHRQFARAGLDRNLPFNFSARDYDREKNAHACHLNPARIAWVRDRAAGIGKGA
ncbi:hypothetical protein SIO49_002495 [Citrobacter freundii]|nr:hypothetical protein [Citrobacter freundii]ELW9355687.1 hypothetical protein [Citrobacter freundii]